MLILAGIMMTFQPVQRKCFGVFSTSAAVNPADPLDSFLNRDSPDDSRTGVNIHAFPAL
jgi:hypothetical protein